MKNKITPEIHDKSTGELLSILMQTHSPRELNQYLDEYTLSDSSLSFCNIFCARIEQSPLTKAEIIRRSNLDRTYAYQILNGTKLPGRDKVLALSIAAELSLKETQQMLKFAKEAILYSRSLRDSIIIYGIEHHFTVLQINELLNNYDETPLL